MEKGGLLNLTPKKSVSTSDDVTCDAARTVAVETVFVMVYGVLMDRKFKQLRPLQNEQMSVCVCVRVTGQ